MEYSLKNQVLHKDRKIPDRVSRGTEAFLGGVPLTITVLYDPVGPLEPSEPCQDTPVLHNSNWGGIRTGRFLTGFPGVQRHFWEEYP